MALPMIDNSSGGFVEPVHDECTSNELAALSALLNGGPTGSEPVGRSGGEAVIGALLAQIGKQRAEKSRDFEDVVALLTRSALEAGDRGYPAQCLAAWMTSLASGYALGLSGGSRKQAEAVETRKAAIRAVERERARLARELHDEAGQLLAAATSLIDQALAADSRAGVSRSKLEMTRQLILESSRSLHQLSQELRPPILSDLGLTETLSWLVRQCRERYPFALELTVGEIGDERDPDVDLAVFRLVQEALTNAAKHAQAKKVKIVVEVVGAEIAVMVSDDGRGFAKGRQAEGSERGRPSLGLLGLEERVGALGGKFEVRSVPGVGTTVSARIPCKPEGMDLE